MENYTANSSVSEGELKNENKLNIISQNKEIYIWKFK